MTDRELLIKKLIAAASYPYSMDSRSEIELLADYLLKNGVIVPPVSVGQKVWYIKGGYYNSVNKKPCEIEVTEINQKLHNKILSWGFIANGTRYRFSSIEKTVFLTREEAEQALKKLKEGDIK